MTENNENQPTEKFLPQSLDARVASLETITQTGFSELNTKVDLLIKLQQEMIKMQQEMYVDLRKRIADLNDPLGSLAATVNQIQRDIQPDSFQNRLMRMGQ